MPAGKNTSRPTNTPLRVDYDNLPDLSGQGRGRITTLRTNTTPAPPPPQNRTSSTRPSSARQRPQSEDLLVPSTRPTTARSLSARRPAPPATLPGIQSPRKVNPKTAALNSLVDAVSPEDRETFLRGLGMNREVYDALCQVARDHDCLIFIRSTNAGILEGLEHGHNVTGKTLFTKGKSSRYLPVKANVAFLASLAKSYLDELKKVNSDLQAKNRAIVATAKSRQIALQEKLHHDQDALMAVIDETHKETLKIGPLQYPTFLHIPKLLPLHRIIDIYGNATSPATPEWIHLKIDDNYICEVTFPNHPPHRLGPSGVTTTTPLAMPSVTREFLWVKIGSFAQVDTNFQTQMKGVPLPGWNGFDAHLAPQQNLADDNEDMYQLFFLESSLLETTEVQTYWQKTVSDPDETGATQPLRFSGLERQQWLQAFAPTYAGPVAVPPGMWRALSVLAQGKKVTDGTISYFEIVADFDIFCICPSLTAIDEALGHQFQPDWEQRLSYFQPQVLSRGEEQTLKLERGMISPFEEAIRKAINQALSKTNADEASSSAASPSGSGARFALHGCEVNNYFYTEKFGRLIFIRPDGMDGNRRFTFATDAFVNMAGQADFTEPLLRIKTRTGQAILPGAKFSSAIGAHYLFQYNLQWNDKDHRPEAKPLFVSPNDMNRYLVELLQITWSAVQELAEGIRRSNTTNRDAKIKELNQLSWRTILRLAFHAGHYYSIFTNLENLHDKDDALQSRRKTIRDVFVSIQTVAQSIWDVMKYVQFANIKSDEHKTFLRDHPFAPQMTRQDYQAFVDIDDINAACFHGDFKQGIEHLLFLGQVLLRIQLMLREMQETTR